MESSFREKKVFGKRETAFGKPELRTPPKPTPPPAAGPRQLIDMKLAFDMVARVLAGATNRLPPSIGTSIRRSVRHAATHGFSDRELEEALLRLPPAMEKKAREGLLTGRWMLVLSET